MKQQRFAILLAALLITLFSTAAYATGDIASDDTDARMVDAKVVEVTDSRVSVIAQTGVEHVIAIDNADTRVTIDGAIVSLKDVREGDVVTIELDANKNVKFAKKISLRSDQMEVARVRRSEP